MREKGVAVSYFIAEKAMIPLFSSYGDFTFLVKHQFMMGDGDNCFSAKLRPQLEQVRLCQSHGILPKRKKVGLMELINNVVQAGIESGYSV